MAGHLFYRGGILYSDASYRTLKYTKVKGEVTPFSKLHFFKSPRFIIHLKLLFPHPL